MPFYFAASHGETRLVFNGFVDEDGEAGGTVIVLAWSTEDLVESHFVKATDAFDRSMHKFRILVLVDCPEQQMDGGRTVSSHEGDVPRVCPQLSSN